MPISPYRFRLATLRRSVRLAAFVLAVFVLRIGMVAACIPSDLAELVDGGHAAELSAATDHQDSPAGTEHSQGHCLHCSCHHAVTLPPSIGAMPTVGVQFLSSALPVSYAAAPPDLSLRPPIR